MLLCMMPRAQMLIQIRFPAIVLYRFVYI